VNRDIAYLHRDFARFYDWTYEGLTEDIPFYLKAARDYGSPLLELACGTGRLTIPLAQAGFTITGLDLSPEMLAIARHKLDREPPEVRARLRLVQDDMCHFCLDEQFGLAFIPQSSLFHVHANEARVSCLSGMREHLAPGGAAIIDLSAADLMANQAVGETVVVGSGVSAATGKMTRELNTKLALDREQQRVTCEHIYIEEEPDGAEHRYTFVGDYAWLTESQTRDLLRAAGFGEASVFGGHDWRPFTDDAPRMIFLARK
jgi:SAM-dependent methyltransferase